jgi:alpha-beta hydrolase superfamily lysophospholipase
MISVFFEGVDWLTANIQKYSYPCIIMHGENDQIVPKECSHYLYNHGSSQDKTLKIFPELYHEILNEEQEKDSILEEIHNWVENRL